MKHRFLLLFILMISGCTKGPAIDDQTYPWQINITPQGNSQVFGIELDVSRLGHVAKKLNAHYELGLFEDKQGRLSLEAYFSDITRGGLSGRLIALLAVEQQQLQKFKINSLKRKPQESGVLKYQLVKADQKISEQFIIHSLSYIPYVNLDKEMIEKRFGMTSEIFTAQDGLVHYLYRKKGLDIIYSVKGKEVLQYVSPQQFRTLVEPLKKQSAQ